jgi:2-polyprenyl-6-methoxyphenol hydroxylase-like FAD-dependent oxidoreductase
VQVEYQTGFKASPPRAVIVGSGPGGLRTAIEFAFLGVRATVLEKRLDYSRNNLLHIWYRLSPSSSSVMILSA